MLRLNIRCLNNQARFDLQRRPAKRRRKGEESRKGERASKTQIRRKRENVRLCVCVSSVCLRKEYESTWFRRRRVREKEWEKGRRRRRRFRFRPSGNRTRSSPFLVFDPHQILSFPPVPICVLHRVLLCATLLALIPRLSTLSLS